MPDKNDGEPAISDILYMPMKELANIWKTLYVKNTCLSVVLSINVFELPDR